MQKIEKVTSRAYAKLGNGLEFNPTETGKLHSRSICSHQLLCAPGGLHVGIKSLKNYTSNEGVFHEDYAKYLDEQTLEGLNKLVKDVAYQSKSLRKKLQQASLQKVAFACFT